MRYITQQDSWLADMDIHYSMDVTCEEATKILDVTSQWATIPVTNHKTQGVIYIYTVCIYMYIIHNMYIIRSIYLSYLILGYTLPINFKHFLGVALILSRGCCSHGAVWVYCYNHGDNLHKLRYSSYNSGGICPLVTRTLKCVKALDLLVWGC